ncbi:serine hydrolase domain-containing protein [Microbacterium sp. NPDC055910]|uniref:serine hydrolase domain-containing protein n=1 Tax=Microbacterium sp. NPDC055910 TaxID=3345659 RepID=UPI0035DAA6AE
MDATFAALQELIDRTAEDAGIPGAAVAVVHDGVERLFTTGVASVAAPAPVTIDTLFMTGSTTKTVTATTVLALVEEGRLDLDRPVADLLPELRLSSSRALAALTPRHLLTHTGGFEGDIADDESDWSRAALERSIAQYGELPQYAPPGESFSYSNAGFRLLGRLLEVVDGDDYDIVVRRRVLEPLGMGSSLFLPWDVFSRPHVAGHEVGPDGASTVVHTWGLGRSALPEGGLVSSIADQARYLRFHLDGTAAVSAPVSPERRRLMQTAQADAAVPFDAVGLPWLLVREYGTTAVTHGGNVAGIQRSTMTLVPDEGLGVTVLANSGAGGALGAAVDEWCFRTLLGRVPDEPRAAVSQEPRELAPYCGRFDAGTWGIDLIADEGMLRATFFFTSPSDDEQRVLPPPLRLAFTGVRDEVVRPEAPQTVFGRFERGADGAVVRLKTQGRTLRRTESPAGAQR